MSNMNDLYARDGEYFAEKLSEFWAKHDHETRINHLNGWIKALSKYKAKLELEYTLDLIDWL